MREKGRFLSCYSNCQKLAYTLARSSICPAWERAGKHHANPSGAARRTGCKDILLSSRDARSQSRLAVCLFNIPTLWWFVLYKAAPLVPCRAAVLIEVQASAAQRELEASKGQLCARKAQSKLIARSQGPGSRGLQALLFPTYQTYLAPAICSQLVKLSVEEAFTAHDKRPLSLHRKYVDV